MIIRMRLRVKITLILSN